MRTHLIAYPGTQRSFREVLFELERNDTFDYVKLHFVTEQYDHISGCNLLSISAIGLDLHSGIGNDNVDIGYTGALRIVGVDIL